MKSLLNFRNGMALVALFMIASPALAQIVVPGGKILGLSEGGGPGLVVKGTAWHCKTDDASKQSRLFSGQTEQLVSADVNETGLLRTKAVVTFDTLPVELSDGVPNRFAYHSFVTDPEGKIEKHNNFSALFWGEESFSEFSFSFPVNGESGEFTLHTNLTLVANGTCAIKFDPLQSGKAR